jgi:hypothetical protein
LRFCVNEPKIVYRNDIKFDPTYCFTISLRSTRWIFVKEGWKILKIFVTPNSLDEVEQINENVRKWVDFCSNSLHHKFTVEAYGKLYSAQKSVYVSFHITKIRHAIELFQI